MRFVAECRQQLADQGFAVALTPQLLVRRVADHAEPPGLEAGAAVVQGAVLGQLQVGVLQYILRSCMVRTATMQRPAEGVGMQGFELVGGGTFHSFPAG